MRKSLITEKNDSNPEILETIPYSAERASRACIVVEHVLEDEIERVAPTLQPNDIVRWFVWSHNSTHCLFECLVKIGSIVHDKGPRIDIPKEQVRKRRRKNFKMWKIVPIENNLVDKSSDMYSRVRARSEEASESPRFIFEVVLVEKMDVKREVGITSSRGPQVQAARCVFSDFFDVSLELN